MHVHIHMYTRVYFILLSTVLPQVMSQNAQQRGAAPYYIMQQVVREAKLFYFHSQLSLMTEKQEYNKYTLLTVSFKFESTV